MAKILIVDDEQNIREIIREYAEFEGFETAETDDGMKAVKMAKEDNYDLIIMDVMMPKLDGYSAVKEIRKFSDVPVIILSARVEEYDKLFGFEIGVDDYVTKPFSPKELMARISAVLKRSRHKVRRAGDRHRRPQRLCRRQKGGNDAQGIRTAFLSRRKQRHRHLARKAFEQRVGL